MQSFPQPLSAAQEASYLRQYQNGDMHARDILIERNLRLVAHIVKKYIHSGKETDELISIESLGWSRPSTPIILIKAAAWLLMPPAVSTMNC